MNGVVYSRDFTTSKYHFRDGLADGLRLIRAKTNGQLYIVLIAECTSMRRFKKEIKPALYWVKYEKLADEIIVTFDRTSLFKELTTE